MDVWIEFNKYISKIIATLNKLRCCMHTTQIQQIINDQQMQAFMRLNKM